MKLRTSQIAQKNAVQALQAHHQAETESDDFIDLIEAIAHLEYAGIEFDFLSDQLNHLSRILMW